MGKCRKQFYIIDKSKCAYREIVYYIIQYYIAVKMNKLVLYTPRWMNLSNITLSDKKQKCIYKSIIPFLQFPKACKIKYGKLYSSYGKEKHKIQDNNYLWEEAKKEKNWGHRRALKKDHVTLWICHNSQLSQTATYA